MAAEPTVPFTAGYAIGTVLSSKAMERLQADYSYKSQKSDIQVARKKLKDIKLELERKPENTVIDSIRVALEHLDKKEVEIEQNYIVKICNYQPESAGIESPIDWSESVLETIPRGFDTLRMTSTYIMKESKSSYVDDIVDQMSGSASFSGWFVSANVSATMSNRIHSASSSGKCDGSLLLAAFVTTRHVRTFKKLQYDKRKLNALKNQMINDKQNSVYILTDAIMGGCFTGFAHFLQQENSSQSQEKNAKDASVQASYAALASASVEYSNASEKSNSKSSVDVNVKIEINCYGSVPSINRQEVPYKLSDFASLSPSEMKISKQDEADANSLASMLGLDSMTAKRQQIAERRRHQQQDAQTLIVTTLRESLSVEKTQKIQNLDSLLEAFDIWVDNMKNDPNSGVPVGFNHTVLTLEDIDFLLGFHK